MARAAAVGEKIVVSTLHGNIRAEVTEVYGTLGPDATYTARFTRAVDKPHGGTARRARVSADGRLLAFLEG
jgi:hypothetical protein